MAQNPVNHMNSSSGVSGVSAVRGVPVRAKLALILACLFWAISFIATKAALAVIPPLTVVMLRLAVSSLCFLGFWAIRGTSLDFRDSRLLGRLFVLSLFGTGLHYGAQTIGLQYTTASNASLYAVTGPITITVIAALFLRERLTWKKGAGIFFALLGVLMVLGIDTLREFRLAGNVLGDLLVFLSIVMWGVFTVLSKDMTRKLGAVDLTAAVTLMGTLYMIPAGIWEMGKTGFSLGSATVEAWGAVTFLGVTCSFAATLLYIYALQGMDSQKVGVYLYTIPPMTYFFAALYLHEAIGLWLIIGSVVVLAGVFLTERG